MGSDPVPDGVLGLIRENDRVLETLGRAMYEIRAPQKSKKVSYDSLSHAQKHANRQAAVSVITATADWPLTSPDDMVEGLARQFYSQLAPKKSEEQPWHTRSEFHHSWYRTQATGFLTALMSGLPTSSQLGSAHQASAVSLTGSNNNGSVLEQALIAKSTVSIDSVHSLAVDSKELKSLQLTSGETLSDLGDESLGDLYQSPLDSGEVQEKSTSVNSGSPAPTSNVIAGMLGLIAILLVVLIIAVIIF